MCRFARGPPALGFPQFTCFLSKIVFCRFFLFCCLSLVLKNTLRHTHSCPLLFSSPLVSVSCSLTLSAVSLSPTNSYDMSIFFSGFLIRSDLPFLSLPCSVSVSVSVSVSLSPRVLFCCAVPLFYYKTPIYLDIDRVMSPLFLFAPVRSERDSLFFLYSPC